MTCPKYTAGTWYEVHGCEEQKAEATFFHLSHFQCLFCYSVPKCLLESSRTVILSIVYSMSVHSTCKCAILTGITVTMFTSKMKDCKSNSCVITECNTWLNASLNINPVLQPGEHAQVWQLGSPQLLSIFFIICWRKTPRMNKFDCCSFSLLHYRDLHNLPKSIIYERRLHSH